jgi:hypothetical protein
MKQILNNLWSQRGQNVWLFAELVLVCFVAWTQIDPIVVNLFYKSLPAGFDIDRLVVAEVKSIKSFRGEGEVGDEVDMQEDELFRAQMLLLKEHLMAQGDVESVTCLDNIGGYPRMDGALWQFPVGNDTLTVPHCYYDEGEDFFETFGIHPVAGSPSQHEMSTDFHGNQTLVITRSLAEKAYGSAEAALGKQIKSQYSYNEEYFTQTIGGVVEDVSAYDNEYSSWMIFSPNGRATLSSTERIAIRLKPGVNMRRFIEEQNYHIGELATEYLTLSGFTSYQKVESRDKSFNKSHDYDFNLSVATAIFFLINLCLGVIGTFWMQTKRRTEESGIMRAFGATRGRILGMFLAEGFILTTLSMIITCVLYLNYVKTGLGELCIAYSPQPDPTWVANKPLHFLIISGIVYLIILMVVSIGIAIPAWNICRTKVVDALREE